MVYDIVDMFWIARLGREAVAGAASAGFTLWTVEAVMETTTIGCATLIAQAIGAGRPEEGPHVFREAAQLSVLVSIALTALWWTSGPSVLSWMGLTGEAHRAGWDYLRVNVFAIPWFHAVLLMKAVFNAHGDTATETKIMTAALLTNAVADPFLIFGWGPFPELGVAGAGWATILGLSVGLVLRSVTLARRGWIGSLLIFTRLRWPRILHIGVPTASVHAIWTMSYPLLTSVITLFGTAPLAGMTLGHRFEGFAYFTTLGFGVAMSTLVGRAVGAGRLDEARAIAHEGRRLITLILLPACAAFVLIPQVFVGILSPDAATTAFGADYLRAVGLTTVFLGWELSYEGAFNGLGRTRPYMYVSVPLTLARYPVAWVLVAALGLGVSSVWWTISLSTLAKGLVLSLLFRRVARA